MKREDDVIELGAASLDTRGPGGDFPDLGVGQKMPGLADE